MSSEAGPVMNIAPAALLLGVFHSRKFNDRISGKEPNRGQLFRDGVRSKALEDAGYVVRSLDNKHHETDVKLGDEIHCNANFADPRRMSKALRSTFGEDIIFDHIILDYFFSPIGWARERWTANFWRNTLAMLSDSNLLRKGGKLWLPNLGCVQESMDEFRDEITRHYTIEAVEDPMLNPLYAASETVEIELLRCPDALTNVTQLRPLLSFSKNPFLLLTRRQEVYYPAACVTPSKKEKIVRTSAVQEIIPVNLSKLNDELSLSLKVGSLKSPKRKSVPRIISSSVNHKDACVVTPTRISARVLAAQEY